MPLDALATRLGLPRTFLRGLAESGQIPHLLVGGRLRFNEEQVRKVLQHIADGQVRSRKEGGSNDR